LHYPVYGTSIFTARCSALVHADYAVASCSVCPSVISRWYWVDTAKHIIKIFTLRHSSFSVPNVTAIFWRKPPNGVSNAGSMKKLRFSTSIPRYLGNDAR